MYRIARLTVFLFLIPILGSTSLASETGPFRIEFPRVVLSDIGAHMTLHPGMDFLMTHQEEKLYCFIKNQETGKVLFADSVYIDLNLSKEIHIPNIQIKESGTAELIITLGGYPQRKITRVIPAFLSILPPLLAILLALVTRQVIIALFFGIWLGVTFIYQYNPVLGFLHTLDEYIVNSLADPDRIAILIFSLVLGGMVGVVSRSGGSQGIVDKLKHYANNAQKGQLATWAMGVLIFFDDYANTLIVGNTMRPLTDKLRISREKLSYLVDSTAAPVANIAIISTWIGYEISLINQSFSSLGVTDNAYSMYRAEKRARKSGAVLGDKSMPLSDLTDTDMMADENTPRRWYNALIPVAIVITAVSLGLIYSGYLNLQEGGGFPSDSNLIQRVSLIVGNADSFAVLMWASFLGSIAAILLAIFQKILTLQQAIDAWVKGIRAMVMAAIILVCAWAIGTICQDLFTADYVIHLTRQFLTPHWLPLITFLTAAVVSFATGTSWGTMAILMPIAIPLAYKFPLATPGIDPGHATALMLSTTAAVLAGATFGDHCSPISDTTIMSSMASGADHIDHVRTQLPYALTVGLIASFFGYIPVGFDISDWWVLPIGFAVVFMVVRFAGKKTEK
jgi:Na+/H+ antiporter NhaC